MKTNRRHFIKQSTLAAAGLLIFPSTSKSESASKSDAEELYKIGPIKGYTPHVGTLVSMLNYNRSTVIDEIKDLTVAELDYLHDPKSNTIGALVLHLGAVDKFYQVNTFENRELDESEKKLWNAPMDLGDQGRKQIKGHDAKYYIDRISEVRNKTLEELKKKNDEWLFAVDPKWSKDTPLNTYWKWFHVCEHEANHRGQITWLKRRLPGAKEGNE